MNKVAILLWVAALALSPVYAAVSPGETVVVVYNTRMPESKQVAQHYADVRHVPAPQVVGLDLPTEEAMSRKEFKTRLQQPLLDKFVAQRWFEFGTGKQKAKVIQASVRYLVLCYGVPVKITRDETLRESEADKLPLEVRRNEAAVDSELALLPASREKLLLAGPVNNPAYTSTNRLAFSPTNSILMVARLDGPTPEIALHLVDKAMLAESNGFWGRAYFDCRGLTNGNSYKIGDDWIRGASIIARRLGFETVLDERPETFSSSFAMSQIALYAGWYDGEVSGPFTRPTVEFMPGAFAYHLHSFSAATLRTTNSHWVGPLLAKGATITFGAVDEPYLSGTPNIAAFLERLIWNHFTFGEAALAAQQVLSWQTTVIGDPLYCPFAEPPDRLHFRLEATGNPMVEWSHLRVVNLNQASGAGSVDEMIGYLNQIPLTKSSAVLQEKLGDLLRLKKDLAGAAAAYMKAAGLNPSPMQRIRLLLAAGDLQNILGNEKETFDAYAQIAAAAPDYPGLPAIYGRLVSLGRSLGKTNEVERYEAELKRGSR